MLYAFFESFKYVGHLFPIAFLRVYLGYYWINVAAHIYNNGLFTASIYVEDLKSELAVSHISEWYKSILEVVVFPNWHFFSNFIVGAQFLVGLSLILGFLVRPMCLVGIIISLHYVFFSPEQVDILYMTFNAVFITLLWVGAGRCLGLDYYFYKRNRGIWW